VPAEQPNAGEVWGTKGPLKAEPRAGYDLRRHRGHRQIAGRLCGGGGGGIGQVINTAISIFRSIFGGGRATSGAIIRAGFT
jgi:hypothetical protein